MIQRRLINSFVADISATNVFANVHAAVDIKYYKCETSIDPRNVWKRTMFGET